MNNTKPMKDFICEMCHASFRSTSGHARYCEDCRKKKQAERSRNYAERKGQPNTNARGAMRICKTCGKEFAIRSASQLYCSAECKPKQHSVSEQVVESRRKNYDTFTFYLPKGSRQHIAIASEKLQMSVSDLLREALFTYLEKAAPEVTAELLSLLPQSD